MFIKPGAIWSGGSSKQVTAQVLLVLVFINLFFLSLPSKAMAAVTAFVSENRKGVYYEYDYEQLLESYAIKIFGQPAVLYEDYASKKAVAYKDNKNGYVDYHDVLEAYAISLMMDKPFDLNSYTAGPQAKKAEMPPSIYQMGFDGTKLVKKEEILLTPLTVESADSRDEDLSAAKTGELLGDAERVQELPPAARDVNSEGTAAPVDSLEEPEAAEAEDVMLPADREDEPGEVLPALVSLKPDHAAPQQILTRIRWTADVS